MRTTFLNFIRTDLEDTFSQVDPWFDRPAALRHFRPAPGRWTIDEVLEHITLTSHFLLKLIDKGGEKALRLAQRADWREALENYVFHRAELDEVGLYRSFDWVRPEHMEPGGTAAPEAVRQLMIEQRDRCLDWLDRLSEGEGILYLTTMSVHKLGKLDVYQYIYFLARHARRHIGQLERNEQAYRVAHP